jgi:hypothetical protein
MRRKLWPLCALLACDPKPIAKPIAPPPFEFEPATLPRAIDTAAVLHELAPVPSGALVIVYDIEGPAGIRGTLEILLADGGRRRDNWHVTIPLEDGAREITGSRVRTPELHWHADGDAVGRVQPSTLAATASAIAALDPIARDRVLDELARWKSELAIARARAGGGEVCTWEELGVPLRYAGPAFRVVARHIETGATLGPHAFDVPADAIVDAPAPPQPDAPQLSAILAGDRAAIVRLLRPELDPLPGLLPG